MSYKLEFHPKALKEFKKLDAAIKEQFKKKLKQRLEKPRVQKDKLSGYPDLYKIKLRSAGFRMAYQVKDDVLIVTVIAVGKRENDVVYKQVSSRVK
jgi:mRNA interferase RelE/StbE